MDDLIETPVTLATAPHLAGVLVRPQTPKLAVLVNGATGVKAGFYLAFARWLAKERHAAVLVWDYRDFGASGAPYRSTATMTDWAIHDPLTARRWLQEQAPGVPLWLIGHSLGGMAAAFQDDANTFERIITVAAGHGHIRAHPWPYRAKVYLLWYLLGPVGTAVLGYLPGRRIGLGNDLPKGVFWQWRDWLLDPAALPGDARLGGVRDPGFAGPLTLVAMADDALIPPPCVARMARWHPHARAETRILHPADFGLTAIGHIHPFAPRNAACWPAIIAPPAHG
ncbi:MAG: alpha/beta hydrolase [Paracoccaceae bacterium]